MKRKIFTAVALALYAMILIVDEIEAQDRLAASHQAEIQRIIARVRFALETQANCRNLFSNYQGDPRQTLDRATFTYVGDALEPLGFAAATLIGTNQILIGAGFYQDMTDVGGMATVLIHELMHQQGAGAEIDNYVDNYEQIATACGTRNSAR